MRRDAKGGLTPDDLAAPAGTAAWRCYNAPSPPTPNSPLLATGHGEIATRGHSAPFALGTSPRWVDGRGPVLQSYAQQ
jgi:hypothetical protein